MHSISPLFSEKLVNQAKHLLETCEYKNRKIVTAESCTGGLIAALLTEIPGSSSVFERGFITYSNESKQSLLGVGRELLEQYGAVSRQAAQAMAQGALLNSGADASIVVTGIAGPGGGTETKPVGLVYIAVAGAGDTVVEECHFRGSRGEIRLGAVEKALAMASAFLTQ